jgi:hypothetical protein
MIKTGICLMILVAFFVCGDFNPASAATLTVSNTSDSGGGSLRDAISTAVSGDTINFSVTGTITLTTGPLLISQNLTIVGPGAPSLTISGGGSDRIFGISAGTTVNISELTISDGFFGGAAIFNSGTVILTDVVISNNSAGGGDGGGIFNNGGTATATLTNVTISGNSATGGGGIYNDGGTLTLTNVTISGNTATDGGAGIGGGIFNEGGTVTLTNVTISGNSAQDGGGGIFNLGGTLTLTNVTISGNNTTNPTSSYSGGGINNLFGGGTVSLLNTIVANSTFGGNCAGTITSLGYNLDSANTCAFTVTGDLINTDPLLGPLALNAPGTTETQALLAGSPAIDAADPSSFPPTDQRGVTRPQGPRADIGAYEFVSPVPTSVPTMTEWGMMIFIVFAGLGSVYYLTRQRRAES